MQSDEAGLYSAGEKGSYGREEAISAGRQKGTKKRGIRLQPGKKRFLEK